MKKFTFCTEIFTWEVIDLYIFSLFFLLMKKDQNKFFSLSYYRANTISTVAKNFPKVTKFCTFRNDSAYCVQLIQYHVYILLLPIGIQIVNDKSCC